MSVLERFPETEDPTMLSSKNICLISYAMLGLLSHMEGYTLEMPGGMSLVRLFKRNLQMLNSVSGMWELKGSSFGQKRVKKKKKKDVEEEYSDKNSEIYLFFLHPILLLNLSIFNLV